MSAPLFRLGQVVVTPGALEAASHMRIFALLLRHTEGDWGCIDPEDAANNAEALQYGSRLISAYPVDPDKPCTGYGDNCLWIITDADRSVTTVLLPEEY